MKKILAVCTTVLLAIGLATTGVIAASATADPYAPVDGKVTVSWLTPFKGAVAPATSDPAIWPQKLYTTPVCGDQWIQTDVYNYKTEADKTLVKSLIAKATLTTVNGTPEDSSVYISHIFTKQTACPPPVVIPNSISTSNTVQCGVATITLRNVSPWTYPVTVKVDGVSSYGPVVDNRTNGKLDGPQKDRSATRTITFAEDTGVHTVEYRVEAGSENQLYKGLAVGEWTTLTVQSDCLPPVVVPVCETVKPDWHNADYTDVSWEIHLGRQIADRNAPALYNPADHGGTVSIVGFDTNMNNGLNTYVHYPEDIGATNVYTFKDGYTLTAKVSAGEAECSPVITWTLTKPIVVIDAPVAPIFTDVCGTTNDSYSDVLPKGANYKYELVSDSNVSGARVVTIKAVPNEGFEFGDVTTQWSFTYTDVPCITTITAEPAGPTFTDKCGTANDTTTLPADTEEYTYSKATVGSTVTVTATALDGFAFGKDAVTSWSHTFTDEACPVVIPPKPDALVTHASSTDAPNCTAGTITTHHSTTTTAWIYQEADNVWVKGTPVTTQDADTVVKASAKDCPQLPLLKALPFTGVTDGSVGLLFGGLGLLLAGVGTYLWSRRKLA